MNDLVNIKLYNTYNITYNTYKNPSNTSLFVQML